MKPYEMLSLQMFVYKKIQKRLQAENEVAKAIEAYNERAREYAIVLAEQAQYDPKLSLEDNFFEALKWKD
jgi:hypothetical protein